MLINYYPAAEQLRTLIFTLTTLQSRSMRFFAIRREFYGKIDAIR